MDVIDGPVGGVYITSTVAVPTEDEPAKSMVPTVGPALVRLNAPPVAETSEATIEIAPKAGSPVAVMVKLSPRIAPAGGVGAKVKVVTLIT